MIFCLICFFTADCPVVMRLAFLILKTILRYYNYVDHKNLLFFIWADLSEKVKALQYSLDSVVGTEKKQKKVDVESMF